MFYHDILVFLHLVSLAVGLGLGTANIFLGRWAAASQSVEEATLLRSLPPRLAQISTVGLGVLIITGILLVFDLPSYINPWSHFWFWMKLLAVAGMVVIVYFVMQAQRAIRDGKTPQFGEYLPMAGPAIGGLALLATLFATFVFH
jgi:uncharacterized membrane protein SirB2